MTLTAKEKFQSLLRELCKCRNYHLNRFIRNRPAKAGFFFLVPKPRRLDTLRIPGTPRHRKDQLGRSLYDVLGLPLIPVLELIRNLYVKEEC